MRLARRDIMTIGIAAVISTAGTATAAGMITSAQIKDHTIQLRDISSKARAALKGNRGPAGPKGGAGVDGTNGSTYIPVTTSVSNSSITWGSPGGSAVGSEAGAQRPVPPGADGNISNLSVHMTANASGGDVVFTVRINGVDSALTCTVTDGTNTCTSTATAAVVAGDLLSVKVDNAGTVDTAANGAFTLG